MPTPTALDHVFVHDRVESRTRAASGGGRTKIRNVDRVAHGSRLLGEAQAAFDSAEASRAREDLDEVLRATGTYLTVEGPGVEFGLQLDSLTAMTRARKNIKRPKWLLLAVHPATNDTPERAVIWVADEFRAEFIRLFEDYLNPEKDRTSGNPKNNALIANIAKVRTAFLEELWTSATDAPRGVLTWWELWLDERRELPGMLERVLKAYEFKTLNRRTRVGGAGILYVCATWEQLESLTATGLPLTEIRSPSFIVETTEDLNDEEQRELVVDLVDRLRPAAHDAPAVCHLDTGVFRGHKLIGGSLSSTDVHSIIGSDGGDRNGHGTSMAGIALYGTNLEDYLLGSQNIELQHRLESVRFLTGNSQDRPERKNQRDYASATIEAVSRPEIPEITGQRRRAYCMPISAKPDAEPGTPTLWSAAVDALAAGTGVVVQDTSISLLSEPDWNMARLIIVSAANVDEYSDDPLTNSELSPIEDPGQSWNALTVGAFTDFDSRPGDHELDYRDYRPLVPAGELSPHSRTSLLFGDRQWPIKPEICLEGGNVLTDGHDNHEPIHPMLSLRSTGVRNDVALTSANATSAATAQAARLAALAMARYPAYWPETVRGLLVHEAAWTRTMLNNMDLAKNKGERARLLRRYGWGVPTEESVLSSSRTAVTMVVQDEFQPLSEDYTIRELRLHTLPWPREVLRDLGSSEVRLRLTLSYFIEPSATRRGWRGKYGYASHGLRFDLQGPTENSEEFLRRINRQAGDDEDHELRSRSSSFAGRWFLGPQARNNGSLHQDEWIGTGAELAACNHVAVYPVGGWWKNNRRQDRRDVSVRYALLISLTTREQNVDLYTPIANELQVPVHAVEIGI
ncbi:S8 family peptidase [Actinomyces sp. 565]|uniref:S8 family serine peptidase n=1 Tax=Actinomyces sp. 565 TaxID=2057794 RepID=UPI00193A4696